MAIEITRKDKTASLDEYFPKKSISIELLNQSPIVSEEDITNNFVLQYKGKRVLNLTNLVLKIVNDGKNPLSPLITRANS